MGPVGNRRGVSRVLNGPSLQEQDQDLEDVAEEIEENLDEQVAEYERNLLEDIELVIHNTCGICDADYVGSTRCSTSANFYHDTEPCSTVEKDGDSA